MPLTDKDRLRLRIEADELLQVGFRTREALLRLTSEALPTKLAKTHAKEIAGVLKEQERVWRRQQSIWPEQTDCERLETAFGRLTRLGILSRLLVESDPDESIERTQEECEELEVRGHPMLGIACTNGQFINIAIATGELVIDVLATDEQAQSRIIAKVRKVLKDCGLKLKPAEEAAVTLRVAWQNRRIGEFPNSLDLPPAK